MKITKYEHACLVVEEQGKILVIDPGTFTRSLPDLENVGAIVVTHIHPDHFDLNHLEAILKRNPSAKVFTTSEVAKEFKNSKPVSGGSSEQAGPFKLDFYGGQHATIHGSFPPNQNVGVMVNDRLYYPGDSFAEPGRPVEALAVPAIAPWMKISEAMDFLTHVKPKIVFPTHNALYSETGQGLADRLLGGAADSAQVEYRYLKPGESLEV